MSEWVLTYRHGRLLRVSSDHLDGDPGADERPHGLFDPGPGRVDDAHQTQEGQVPHLSAGRERQNCRERQTCVQCSWADRSTLIFSPVLRQFTSESGAAHVADLLLVQLPLLVVERQCASSAVVGAAESDHLLVRSLHEVNSRFVLMMWRTEQRTKWEDTNLIFKHIITSSGSEMRETKERFQRREGNNSALNCLWFIPSLRWTLVPSYSDLFLPLSLQQLFIYSVYNAVRVCYINRDVTISFSTLIRFW